MLTGPKITGTNINSCVPIDQVESFTGKFIRGAKELRLKVASRTASSRVPSNSLGSTYEVNKAHSNLSRGEMAVFDWRREMIRVGCGLIHRILNGDLNIRILLLFDLQGKFEFWNKVFEGESFTCSPYWFNGDFFFVEIDSKGLEKNRYYMGQPLKSGVEEVSLKDYGKVFKTNDRWWVDFVKPNDPAQVKSQEPQPPQVELWWQKERREQAQVLDRLVSLRNDVRRICGQQGNLVDDNPRFRD